MIIERENLKMRKNITSVMIMVGIISTVFQGCATYRDKVFVKQDMTSLSPLKVVRYETPNILKLSPGGTVGGLLLGGPIGLRVSAELSGKKLREKIEIPDFGQLVMDKFVARAGKEIPNWPAMDVEKEPVNAEHSYKAGSILEFKLTYNPYITFEKGGCFGGVTTAVLKNANGNVLWKRSFGYLSKEYGRQRKLEEFEADNGKLLKEEMDFAAEETVSNFIKHFQGEK